MTQEAIQSGCERPGAAVPNYYKLGEFRKQFIFSEHKGIWRPELEICSIGHNIRVGRPMFSLKFLWQNPVSPLPTFGSGWQFLLMVALRQSLPPGLYLPPFLLGVSRSFCLPLTRKHLTVLRVQCSGSQPS